MFSRKKCSRREKKWLHVLCQKTDDELSQKEHLGQENEWVLSFEYVSTTHLFSKKVDYSANLYISLILFAGAFLN